MMTNEAIVLAGGLGTRLQGVLPDMPKCMVPVNGMPFLTYVLDYLMNQNIHKVILSLGYRKEYIINYFKSKYRELEIEYSIENEPLGTGGALKLALDLSIQDTVFVINGDTYFVPDLSLMHKLHNQTSAQITIAVKNMQETERYGLIQVNQEGRITKFIEKKAGSGEGLINGGIYLMNRKILKSFSANKFSLENDFFKLLYSTLHMQAYQTNAFFLDIGVPDDYARAQKLIPPPTNI